MFLATAEGRGRIEAYLEAAFPGHDALPYVRGQYWTVALRSRDPGRNHVLEVSEEFLTSHPPDEIVALLDAWRLVEEFHGGCAACASSATGRGWSSATDPTAIAPIRRCPWDDEGHPLRRLIPHFFSDVAA